MFGRFLDSGRACVLCMALRTRINLIQIILNNLCHLQLDESLSVNRVPKKKRNVIKNKTGNTENP